MKRKRWTFSSHNFSLQTDITANERRISVSIEKKTLYQAMPIPEDVQTFAPHCT